ncbi:hypothetical protein SAMN05660420_03012 [Desulfuromusa kysingii]|uniref:Uncharacterized protein n=1 Tax=Desulfuromusa kysingii TaxID=37625 RepID=A0A1H4DPQ6_9BACT|nr:hypothetical protein [Desulfuromusa kysingii]SEA74182.1 hypothetical protein SAMN05660420_03012 [Desulfuromusa kysingii]
MMIKVNSKESVEIVPDVFVNIINESGANYISWDELTEGQVETFSGLSREVQDVYNKFKDSFTA